MMQFLWASATPGDVVLIVLPWVVALVILAVAYAKTKRWDPAWKDRWEHRHAAALETLRRRKQQTLKAVILVRQVVLAVFFMSVGFGLWPIISAISESNGELASVIGLFVAFAMLVFLGFAVFAAGAILLKHQLSRIDELLAAESKR